MNCPLSQHPLRHTIALQLKTHPLLAGLDSAAHAELLELVEVQECHRGERLLEQGSRELRHFFIIEGVLKRVVTSAQGREMALHFSREGDIETSYEAHRRQSGSPHAIVCARRALLASLPMDEWSGFMERHPGARQAFQDRVLQLGAAIVDHAVTLLLLDAPSRVHRFSFSHPELVERLPQRDVASHLNLSAETLCRLTRRHRPMVAA